MIISFLSKGWEDYLYWQKNDKKLRRINELIKDCQRHPYEGIGKPEPLRGNLSGYWSRRINTTHRLLYKVDDNQLYILQCRHHYGK